MKFIPMTRAANPMLNRHSIRLRENMISMGLRQEVNPHNPKKPGTKSPSQTL